MKRFFLIAWCVCSWLFMHAGNTLTLSASDGKPGETVTMTASLANSNVVVAVEVIIPLGEYISYVPSSAVLASDRSNGHVLSASQVGEELRIYIYSLSLSSLQGAEGELFHCSLNLGNKPMTQTLQPQVVLSDASGASIACSVQDASITIFAPEMRVQTPVINYGNIPIRSTYTGQLSVSNIGNLPLTISSIAFTDPEFSTADMPVTIPANSTQSIPINYAPTRHGAVTAKLTIYSDAVNGMYNAVRDVTLEADPFSVNELHVGNNSGVAGNTVSIALTMNNMEPIVAGEVRFVLPSALKAIENSFVLSDRSADHQTMMKIEENTLTLYFFSPSNTPLVGEDGEIGSFKLKLDGTSGSYDLNPQNVVLSDTSAVNMVSAFTSGYVTIRSPRISTNTSLSFGDVPITETAETTLSVSNYGNAPLTLERVTFLAEGYACMTSLPVTIGGGNSTFLKIQYMPSVEGAFGTTMQLYSNDPERRMVSITLSGSVYEPNSLSLSGLLEENTCTLSVGMDNYSGISALQFDISGLAENDVQLSPSNRLSLHTATLIPLSVGKYRVIVYNMTNALIPDHEGEVLQLSFSTTEEEINCMIDNIVLSNSLGINKCTVSSVSWASYNPTGIGNVQSDKIQSSKFLRNNQILIHRGDKVYTVTGQEIR